MLLYYPCLNMADVASGHCEHCTQSFGNQLHHCGFGDCSYAHCDKCGMTAVFSSWNKQFPKMPSGCLPQEEICVEMEQYLEPCVSGGIFRGGSSPRCPNCEKALCAEIATRFIEANAAGTKKGWRWQRNWHGTYCIAIERRDVHDNFRPR